MAVEEFSERGLFRIIILVALFFGIRWFMSNQRGERDSDHQDALSILEGRHVRGEIDRKEFEQKKRDLLR